MEIIIKARLPLFFYLNAMVGLSLADKRKCHVTLPISPILSKYCYEVKMEDHNFVFLLIQIIDVRSG